MTESEMRMVLAKQQNNILSRIYQNISSDGFDINVPLGDISDAELRDFWVYTAGFMSVQNFESLKDKLSEKDILNILNGRFRLRNLNKSEVQSMLRAEGTVKKNNNIQRVENLYTIQDGTYRIERVDSKGNGIQRALFLQTSHPEYYTDQDASSFTPSQLFNVVRNLLVHTTPYILGSKLMFLSGETALEISKMWLRGYSELFSQMGSKVNEKELQEILTKELSKTGNSLQDKKDIDKALSLIKNCFDEDVQKTYFRVNNFVKWRTEYYDDFFKKPLEEKIKIISLICAKNPNYISGANETINPSIIYNLQQIISKELSSRSIFSSDTNDDALYDNIFEKYQRYLDLFKETENIAKSGAYNARSQVQRNYQNLQFLRQQIRVLIERAKQRRKLASEQMNLYNIDGLEALPVEVGVNLVSMMGYNCLVTSAFYEDMLAKTSFSTMNAAQVKFFNKINLDNLNFNYSGKLIKIPNDPKDKAFALNCIRNSIVHGNISFVLPPQKQNENVTFKDAVINFYDEHARTSITGKVDDFYKLFTSGSFTKERAREAITGEIIELDAPPENKHAESDQMLSLLESDSGNFGNY